MADNFCRLCGLGMREEPNAICKSVPHWQAWHAIDLRAAYERGVRDAADLCAQDAARLQRSAERHKGDDSKVYEVKVGQYRAEQLSARILALLGKEGGGDG